MNQVRTDDFCMHFHELFRSLHWLDYVLSSFSAQSHSHPYKLCMQVDRYVQQFHFFSVFGIVRFARLRMKRKFILPQSRCGFVFRDFLCEL